MKKKYIILILGMCILIALGGAYVNAGTRYQSRLKPDIDTKTWSSVQDHERVMVEDNAIRLKDIPTYYNGPLCQDTFS